MRFRSIILNFLLLWGSSLFSQVPVARFETVTGAGFRYSSDTSSPFYTNYLVLRELAIENLVEVYSVRLDYFLAATVEINLNRDREPELSAALSDPRIQGNTTFRGFDITPFLLPSGGTVEIMHRDRADSALSRTWSFPGRTFGPAGCRLQAFPIPAFNPGSDTLVIRIADLRYSANDLRRLQERLDLINDYYASSSLLDSLLRKLPANGALASGTLPWSLCDIMELSKATALIISRNFDSTLMSEGEDPRHLKQSCRDALRASRSLIYTFMDVLDSIGGVTPQAGIDSMSLYFVDEMIRFIRLSSVMSEARGNLYGDYLDRYYSLPSFPDERATVRKLGEKIFPGARPDTLLQFISGKIFDAYLLRSRQLIAQHAYPEAFMLIRHARKFREAAPVFNNPQGTGQLLSEAAAGIYASYLGIAATSIEYDKFDMAEIYIQKALDYKRTNEAWFTTDTLYSMIFRKLFRQRLVHCDNLILEGRYRDAVDCYNGFENRFEPEMVAMVSAWVAAKRDTAYRLLFGAQQTNIVYYLEQNSYDSAFTEYDSFLQTYGYLDGDTSEFRILNSTMKLVLPVKYEIMSGRAFHAMEARGYDQAWTYFQAADDVAMKAGIAHDSLYCASRKEAYRYHLMDEIASRTGYIWNDRFDSAYLYIEGVKEKIRENDLEGDTLLIRAIEAYIYRIHVRQCSNSREEAEILVLRAGRNAEGRRYMTAVQQYRAACETVLNLASCGISLAGLEDSVRKYAPAAAWQALADTMQKHYALADYRAVLRDLVMLNSDYITEKLDRFGLDSINVPGYIAGKNNPVLSKEMVLEKMDLHLYEQALFYLEILKVQGTSPKEIAAIRNRIDDALKTEKQQ